MVALNDLFVTIEVAVVANIDAAVLPSRGHLFSIHAAEDQRHQGQEENGDQERVKKRQKGESGRAGRHGSVWQGTVRRRGTTRDLLLTTLVCVSSAPCSGIGYRHSLCRCILQIEHCNGTPLDSTRTKGQHRAEACECVQRPLNWGSYLLQLAPAHLQAQKS